MISTARGALVLRAAVSAGLGAVAGFGLAPYGLWPLAVVALAMLPLVFMAAGSAGQAGLILWAFGSGYFAHTLVWIVEPFFVDAARHGWMAPFALLFLASGLALFWAAAGYAAYRIGPWPAARTGWLVVTLSLAEFARRYVLTGFPWAGIAQIWVDTPVAQTLAWIGPQGLSVLTLAAGLGIGLALLPRGARAGIRLVALLPVLGLVGLTGAAQISRPDIVLTGQTVRLVQPNAAQKDKWNPDLMPVFFNRQLDYSSAGPRPDLIVWPETAVPTVLNYAGPTLEAVADAAAGVPVVLGIQRFDDARIYNSLITLDGAGFLGDIYDKHHLVPFGEYFPLGDIAARFGLRGFAAREGDGYSAGPGPELVNLGPLGRALPLICYEAVFPQDVLSAPERPQFLLQITNDAWFGQYSGPYQHLAQARMRAIETGLPMVRVANTGVSAMIGPGGAMLAHIGLGQAGYVDAVLPAALDPTVYARTGDLAALIGLFAAAFMLWVLQSRAVRTT